MQNDVAAQFEHEVLNSLQPMELELAIRGGMNAVPGPPDDTDPERAKRQLAINEAINLVKRRDVLDRICPGLQSVASNTVSFAKCITPVLLPLAISGAIPMNPLVFAGIAVLFFDAGVKSLCKEERARKEKDD